MAFIPDEVIDDMYSELTSGARDLYIYLARCRNQKTGKCCPSIPTISSSIGLSRPRIYALRKELQIKKWAEFSGNDAILLKGFKSLKNKTSDEENKGVVIGMPASLENKTESLEIETPSLENKTKSLKNKTSESQKQDSHIRKNQQIEPAKEPCTVSPSAPRQDDPFFERFKSAYEVAYGCPYQHRKADFIQLANCKKQGGEWLTLDRWQTGVDHYFASEIGGHTLADLSSRFGAFFRSTLDRFGKPRTTTINGVANVDSRTAANVAVVESWIRKQGVQ